MHYDPLSGRYLPDRQSSPPEGEGSDFAASAAGRQWEDSLSTPDWIEQLVDALCQATHDRPPPHATEQQKTEAMTRHVFSLRLRQAVLYRNTTTIGKLILDVWAEHRDGVGYYRARGAI